MASAAWVEIPIPSIVVGPRLRAVDAATVANLKVSIEESGWFGSILVRPIPAEEGAALYQLVAGAHRLAAMRGLGRSVIAAAIRPLSDDEAEQIEIDENLVRRGLDPLERAEMVAARFGVWRRRFPDRVALVDGTAKPKRGRPANSARFAEFTGGAPETMGFTLQTAADVGLSKRTVEAAWSVVSGIPADLRFRLRGTPVAKNEGLLRQLAAMSDKAEQVRVAEVLIAGQTRNLSDAMAIAAGNAPVKGPQTPVDASVMAFRKVWKDATPSGRAAILHDLAGRSLPKGWTVREADRG